MEAKRLLSLTFVLSFVLAVNINTASALPLWQFGLEDQSWAEFEAVEGGTFQPEYTVSFGNVTVDSPALNSGTDAPGYMYTQNPFPKYSHVDTAAVETLIFEFTLEDDYRQLDLSYGRFGSEIDYLYFDGIEIFNADGATEGQYDLFEYAIIGDIYAGDHTLTLAYGGGGHNNGHYIDFMRLDNGELLRNGSTNSIPEPGTILLVGTGIVGLVCSRYRKRIRQYA